MLATTDTKNARIISILYPLSVTRTGGDNNNIISCGSTDVNNRLLPYSVDISTFFHTLTRPIFSRVKLYYIN